jgi:hypothetical protein
MFFEREKALKGDVGTHQPVRDVRPVLKNGFDFELGIFSFT